MKTQTNWIICDRDSWNSGICGNLELMRTRLLIRFKFNVSLILEKYPHVHVYSISKSCHSELNVGNRIRTYCWFLTILWSQRFHTPMTLNSCSFEGCVHIYILSFWSQKGINSYFSANLELWYGHRMSSEILVLFPKYPAYIVGKYWPGEYQDNLHTSELVCAKRIGLVKTDFELWDNIPSLKIAGYLANSSWWGQA